MSGDRFLQDARTIDGPTAPRGPDFEPARVRAHQAALTARARRLGFRGADVDEIAQSTWATFLEILPRFGGRSQLRTFLIGILEKKALEARRAAGRLGHMAGITPNVPGVSDARPPGADEVLSASREREALRSCVDALPAKERGAVERRLLREEGSAEVSRALGVTTNHLGVLLHRARAHLRECMGGHVG